MDSYVHNLRPYAEIQVPENAWIYNGRMPEWHFLRNRDPAAVCDLCFLQAVRESEKYKRESQLDYRCPVWWFPDAGYQISGWHCPEAEK